MLARRPTSSMGGQLQLRPRGSGAMSWPYMWPYVVAARVFSDRERSADLSALRRSAYISLGSSRRTATPKQLRRSDDKTWLLHGTKRPPSEFPD
jgi:hypothetical protein